MLNAGSSFGGNSGETFCNISVSLIPPDRRKRNVFDIVKTLRPKLMRLPGAQIFINTGGFLKFLIKLWIIRSYRCDNKRTGF